MDKPNTNVDDKLGELLISLRVMQNDLGHIKAQGTSTQQAVLQLQQNQIEMLQEMRQLKSEKDSLKEDLDEHKINTKENFKELKISVDQAHDKISLRDKTWLTTLISLIGAVVAGVITGFFKIGG